MRRRKDKQLSFGFILERNVVGEIIVKVIMTGLIRKDITYCTRCTTCLQSEFGKSIKIAINISAIQVGSNSKILFC